MSINKILGDNKVYKNLNLLLVGLLIVSPLSVTFSAADINRELDDEDPLSSEDLDPSINEYEEDLTADIDGNDLHFDVMISDWHDLNDVRNDLEGNYELTNDLDENSLGYDVFVNTEGGWDPIGDDDDRFVGTFDGNGYNIRDLYINRPDQEKVGLFGVIGEGGLVENLGLVDIDIMGEDRVGGLVGDNQGGEVVNSYSTGKVSGFIAVGGLAGYNRNIIDMSNSQASVSGDTNVIGGLVGVNFRAEILNSYATGEVTTKGFSIGGLVGNNYQSLISNSYATGNVYGGRYNVGGLVGYNYATSLRSATVNDSYATGSVEGDNRVGGLVGLNNEQGEVEFSYATGLVDCDDRFGGFVGVNEGLVSDSFYDRETTGCDDEGKGEPEYTYGMMSEDTFTDVGWDFETDWWMIDGGTRPFLRMEWNTEIRNSHQLQMMQMDLSEDYILVNNIDLTGYLTEKSRMWGADPPSRRGFQPVGEWTGSSADEFTGSLNGNNYTITGLYISISPVPYRYIGLFGYLGEGGSIRNVGLEGVDIKGNRDVGGLVGYNGNGTIDNTYATGSIRLASTVVDSHRIGGLVGFNRREGGIVSNSYADVIVDVDQASNVGGLIGSNSGGATVKNSYAMGDVHGNDKVGGLVGNNVGGSIYNSSATGNVNGNEDEVGGLVGYTFFFSNDYKNEIHNSYATGSVTGSDYVSGFIGNFSDIVTEIHYSYSTGAVDGTGSNVGGFCGGGREDTTNLVSNFWDTDTSGKDTGFGDLNLDEIEGRNTTDMMTKSTFTAATWDFEDIWWMVDGQTRPFLRMEWSNEIRNSHQLQMMIMDLEETYELSNDIDFSGYLTDPSRMWGTSPTSGTGFVPVGERIPTENRFTGLLDGQGNTITGVYINDEDLNNVGLIGYMDGGTVNNLGLLDAEVIGRNYVGTIVGYNLDGELSNSYATGSVIGNVGVGGLLGRIWNGGKVSNSHYDIEDMMINGGDHITVGALFGEQYDDWFSNELSLDISEYDDTLVPTEGYYEISDIHGLRDILGFAPIHSYEFRLGSDIDFSVEPGLFVPYLAADFYGDGYTISNLKIDQDFSVGLGMFGYNRYGLVDNVSLVDVDIIGGIDTGGLVGNNHGTISSSYVTGDIMGTSNVGGLLGVNYDSVKDSHTTASVIGTTMGIGGLVGNNRGGSISHSYSTGNVNGTADYVGGLAGFNHHEISNSYATGDVEGSDNVGGLVGYDYGEIFDSYSHGNLNGFNNVGGLVGYHIGHVERSYSAGHVSGMGNNIGGLVGTRPTGPYEVIDSFWDNKTSGQSTSDGGEGRNTTDMMDNTTFADADWDITDVVDINERDEEYIWNIVDIETYPFFSWETTKSTHPLAFDVTAGDGYVDLSWEEPKDDGGAPITEYNIYRGTSSGELSFYTSVSGIITSYRDDDITNGVTYYYHLSAVNSAGEGPKTEEKWDTPLGSPSAPQNFQAKAYDGYVDLDWEEPDDDGGSSIISYKIYRGTSSGDLEFFDDVDETTFNYRDNDVTNGVTYYYQVCARNDVGDGEMCIEVSATPVGIPSAPQHLEAIPGDSTVELEWSAPDDDGGSMITAYRIYRGTTSGSLSFFDDVEGDTLSYTDTGLTNGQTYFYQVSAVNDVDEGKMSSEMSATPMSEPKLTITIIGEGNTDPSEGTHTYEEDETVVVEAIPDEAWIFSYWTGDVPEDEEENEVIEIVMDDDKSLTAHFEESEVIFEITNFDVEPTEGEAPLEVTITAHIENIGDTKDTIALETNDEEINSWRLQPGDSVSVDEDYTYDEEGVYYVNLGPESIMVNVGEVETFTLDVSIEGEGKVEIDSKQEEYEDGTVVELTAEPDDGWYFVEWTGDHEDGYREITIIMDADKTLKANFEEIEEDEYILTINTDGGGTTNPEPGDHVYKKGEEVTVEAIPTDDWYFVGWTKHYEGTEEEFTIVMDSNKEITAWFDEAEAIFETEITNYDEEVEEGENITLEYRVQNIGNIQGTQDLVFVIDGDETTVYEALSLGALEDFTGEFTWTPDTAGEYEIGVLGDSPANFVRITVQEVTPDDDVEEEDEPTFLSEYWWLIILLMIALVVVIVVIMVMMKGDKEEPVEEPIEEPGDTEEKE